MYSVGGGGVVAVIFRDPYSVGGGVVAEIFRDPYSVGWQNPLTAVTYQKFVLFKHVLCFARIMSTLPEFMSTNCPDWGGAAAPRPVRLWIVVSFSSIWSAITQCR